MEDVDAFDVGPAAPNDKLEDLNKLLEEAIALEEAVAQMEEDLKAAKGALHGLRTNRIPDLMAELQMDSVTFRGWSVKVEDFVSGSLPKDPQKQAAAIAWLEAHDAGGLIKTQVAVAFGREQREEAIGVFEGLTASGHTATLDSTVHAQTLQAFARQRIKDGDDIDTEVLGLYVGKVAKMKAPKA